MLLDINMYLRKWTEWRKKLFRKCLIHHKLGSPHFRELQFPV